jgi:peptidoglycan/LPS O-acetylase OafA/YrhL
LPLVAVAVGLALNGIRIEELWSAATAYAVLWLGFAPAPRLLGYNRAGDYSYGTYIYGFVIQQMIAALMPDVTPLEMISLSLPLAVLAGALSWYLVERPAIALRRFTRSATTTTPVAL